MIKIQQNTLEKSADTNHDIHVLLAKRWSPRAFRHTAPDSRTVLSLFEAARWAASANNGQPWAFLLAESHASKDHARIVECLNPGNQLWARAAPILVLAFARILKDDGSPNHTALYDLGLAVAQLTFQAEDMGLRMHQMAGIKKDHICETFKIPKDWCPVTAIAMGYQGPPEILEEEKRRIQERAPRKRKPLSEFVFAQRFGQASPILSIRNNSKFCQAP